MAKPHVYVILGPTASGKTAYGIELAKKIGGAVISADSRQVYAGMNIGTATPLRPARGFAGQEPHDILTPDAVEGVDHYLFNIATPDKPITLSDWQSHANTIIEHLVSQNSTPVLVGGTMLYIDSIVKNYSLPSVPPQPALRKELEQYPTEDLYARLLEQDPEAKRFVEPHHKQRIIRALEVIDVTGTPFSTQRIAKPSPYAFELIGLFPTWKTMQERIAKRHEVMLKEGLLEETAALQKRYGKDLPLLSTMNYKQAANVLDGTQTFEEALEETIRVNMRYARRQMSWWKNRKEIRWV